MADATEIGSGSKNAVMPDKEYPKEDTHKEKSEEQKERSSKESILGAVVTGVLIAVIPGVLAFAFSVVDDHRKQKLDFVNLQIEKLYGPLYSVTQANTAVWDNFKQKDWPIGRGTYFPVSVADKDAATIETQRWRLWIKNVFQPMNLQIEKSIIENYELLVGEKVPPPSFREMVAHIESYKAIIAAWDQEDRKGGAVSTKTESNKDMNWPENFNKCVEDSYELLKARQSTLKNFIFSDYIIKSEETPESCNK
jgi:hypothetical protein